jgi:predicted transcriptional regulator
MIEHTDQRQDVGAGLSALDRALIAEALDELAHGLVVDHAEVDGWIESIGTDHELPPPFPAG